MDPLERDCLIKGSWEADLRDTSALTLVPSFSLEKSLSVQLWRFIWGAHMKKTPERLNSALLHPECRLHSDLTPGSRPNSPRKN